VPIGTKKRARWNLIETPLDIRPSDVAMLAYVPTGDLIGNTLIAERAQQPVEYLGCVPTSNGLKHTGFSSIDADIIKKRQRSGQAADPSDQINRAIVVLGDIVVGNAGLASRRLSCQIASWDRSQIRDTNLRCASLSPSM
jgi:hypothetical protein